MADFQENNQNSTTDVTTLYNNRVSSMKVGYFKEVGFISISPIFDAYIGRDPEPGAKMYNHDKKIFFPINYTDVIKLKKGFRLLDKGEINSFTIKHLGDKKAKIMTVGHIYEDFGICVYLCELSEDRKSIINEVAYEFASKDGTLFTDVDDNFNGNEIDIDVEYEFFKSFINSVEKVVNKESNHGNGGASEPKEGIARGFSTIGGEAKRRRPISPNRSSTPVKTVTPENASSLFDEDEEE
jgi:hypothetical protein